MLTLGSACGNGDTSDSSEGNTPKSSPPSSSQPAKPKDPGQVAKEQALVTYEKYWSEMKRAYAQSSTEGTDIEKYAGGLALVRVQQDTKGLKSDGQAFMGDPVVSNSTVTRLGKTQKGAANATISSCIDVSGWDLVNVATQKKEVMPTDRLTKYVNVTSLEQWPDGWKVIENKQAGSSC
ncbi:hypothetical protein OG521_00360 [Streptomyces sp. NBC_01463]